MKKSVSDAKVKKTLLRNYEQKVRTNLKGVHDVDAGSSKVTKQPTNNHIPKDSLDEPKLCSSEALANYLSDVRKTVPPPLSPEDLNIDGAHISAKVNIKGIHL